MDAPSAGPRTAIDADRGAAYLAGDCGRQNFYAIDRGLRDLLPLYLAAEDLGKLEPPFDRMGRSMSLPARPAPKWAAPISSRQRIMITVTRY